MNTIDLHVGYDPASAKARVLKAMHRAETGATDAERHVTFESWEGLTRTLGGKRLDLLRHVGREPVATVATLARALGRDYKRVHEDAEILMAAGLLDRTDDGGIRVGYDEIRTFTNLVPAA
jgi:predicted transcriptional regulator